MRVVVGPVVIDGRICRIVSPLDSLLEVEEWAGDWWAPSTVPLTAVSNAPLADAALLFARHVPQEDWTATVDPLTRGNIEALMRPEDPARAPGSELDSTVRRADPPRPREYPGNARFGVARKPVTPRGIARQRPPTPPRDAE